MKCILFGVATLWILSSIGCGTYSTLLTDTSEANKLLVWSLRAEGQDANPDTNEERNNEKESDRANKEDKPHEITTDRPDYTEASTTVGKGRVQLETGYTFTTDRQAGSRLSAHSYPEALLRIGVLAEWFELRLGQNFASERLTLPDGNIETVRGAEDLNVGTKLALTEQRHYLPEMALVLQATAPTGLRDFSAQSWLPGCNWLYGWEIVEDALAVGGSTQMNRGRGVQLLPVVNNAGLITDTVEGTHYFLELAQSITVNYTLTAKLGAYTEWFAFFPHSSLDPSVGTEHYLNGGFTYKFTPNIQFDIRAGVGLSRRSDDFFVGTGCSFRY